MLSLLFFPRFRGSFIPQSHLRILWFSFPRTDSGMHKYYLSANLNVLHIFKDLLLPVVPTHLGFFLRQFSELAYSVGWGCRIHRLLLCREKTPPTECPGYDTKQSDGEVPAMMELWGMRSTPSFSSLPGPRWPSDVAPEMGPIYGLNRTNGILMLSWIVWLNWIAWNKNIFDN